MGPLRAANSKLEKAKTQLGLGGPKYIAGSETLKAIGESAKWPTLSVPVVFLSRVEGGTPRANSSDCLASCEQMMRETSNVSSWVVPGNQNSYVIECAADDLKDTKPAIEYLTGQLQAGKLVMIGVDYKQGTGKDNLENIGSLSGCDGDGRG